MRTALLVAGLVSLSIAAHAEMDAKTFIAGYDAADPVEKRLRTRVLESTENGVGWANVFFKNERNQQPLYCQPEKLALTGDQLLDMLRREVSERPTLGNYPYGMAIIYTLKRVFPCPSK